MKNEWTISAIIMHHYECISKTVMLGGEINQGPGHEQYDNIYVTSENMQNKVTDCWWINIYAVIVKHTQDW